MPVRHLPVCPNLDQLRHQAKDLLRDIHAGEPAALAELREFHPNQIDPADRQARRRAARARAKLRGAELDAARPSDGARQRDLGRRHRHGSATSSRAILISSMRMR